VSGKKRLQHSRHDFNKFKHSFVIFRNSRKFSPNIIILLRSADVIVTSLEMMLSRTIHPDKRSTIFYMIILEK